ncbi:MAG: DUF5798 family protein [Natronomonas sp.]
MGLGGATRKLQKVADMGEELYGRMNELLEQVVETQETVNDTHERVGAIENRLDQQGVLLEALAEKHDIDVDALLTEVAIEPAETDSSDGEPADETTIPDAETDDEAGKTDDGAGEPDEETGDSNRTSSADDENSRSDS